MTCALVPWLWPCALPGASSGASAAGWPACWCFRGLGAGEGLGGFAAPHFGRANAFPSAPQKHEEKFPVSSRIARRLPKIELLYNYIPILLDYLKKITEKYLKANHSKKSKSSQYKLMKTLIKTQNFNGTLQNLHEKGQNCVVI